MGKYLKEGIILILLTIIIIILLTIALYEYIPKENLSELEKYSRSEQTANIIEEIKTSDLKNNGGQSIIKSYSISAYDLSQYSKEGIYDQARANPFAKVGEENSNNTTNPGAPGNENNNKVGYFNKTDKTTK